jgi:hypothetical protein
MAFGNVDIVFSGDSIQMPSIFGIPIYMMDNAALWYGAPYSYVEMTGAHRFSCDPEWGDVLERLRNGKQAPEDMGLINDLVVGGYKQVKLTKLNSDPVVTDHMSRCKDRLNLPGLCAIEYECQYTAIGCQASP